MLPSGDSMPPSAAACPGVRPCARANSGSQAPTPKRAHAHAAAELAMPAGRLE
jgi:hypothetical protein